MAASDNNNIKGNERATDGYNGSRAIANRSITRARQPERNVPAGNLVELVPGRQYRAIGLDIGSTDFSKTGVGEDFRRIRNAYLSNPGSEIVIWGNVSPSVRTSPAD